MPAQTPSPSISLPTHQAILSTLQQTPHTALPSPSAIAASTAAIITHLPATGLGDASTAQHILSSLTPGFNGSALSSTYFGFVTGRVLPIASFADNVVTAWDQNVQVHLPEESIATVVEDAALSMLVEALGLGAGWEGRTFTTGATASNVLGLACGREAVLRRRGGEGCSVGEVGLVRACRMAGVDEVRVLTSMGHSSLKKAASVVGLGRGAVVDVGMEARTPWRIDFGKLEAELRKERTASIVVVSCGEVNTGGFATDGIEEMKSLRELCDQYGAWLHVDGAFGLFTRCLPTTPEFALLHRGTAGIELANSITGDAHKCLNVPYDCGIFLTRSLPTLTSTCLNPSAAYLTSTSSPLPSIPSPLNTTIENSRRFRALPVYAVLLSLGQTGLTTLIASQVQLARSIAAHLGAHPAFELLGAAREGLEAVGIVVLFRAREDMLNGGLADRVKRDGRVYVSPTVWEGRAAVRIAVAGWRAEGEAERDLGVVVEVLDAAVKGVKLQ